MSLDRASESIAHFVGHFNLSTEEARLRLEYDRFRLERAEEEAAKNLELGKVSLKAPFKLADYDPSLPFAADSAVFLSSGQLPVNLGSLQYELGNSSQPFIFSDQSPSLPDMSSAAPAMSYVLANPSSVATVTIQNNTLVDNDVYGVAALEEFVGAVPFDAALETLRVIAEALQPFTIMLPASMDGWVGFAEEVLTSAQNFVAPGIAGLEVHVQQANELEGVWVDGELVEEEPDWTELKPAYHQRLDDLKEIEDALAEAQEDGTGPHDFAEDFENGPEIGENDYLPFDQIVAGANSLINFATVTSNWLDAQVIVVGGNTVRLDLVSQLNILFGRDSGATSDEGSTVKNVVRIETLTEEEAEARAEAEAAEEEGNSELADESNGTSGANGGNEFSLESIAAMSSASSEGEKSASDESQGEEIAVNSTANEQDGTATSGDVSEGVSKSTSAISATSTSESSNTNKSSSSSTETTESTVESQSTSSQNGTTSNSVTHGDTVTTSVSYSDSESTSQSETDDAVEETAEVTSSTEASPSESSSDARNVGTDDTTEDVNSSPMGAGIVNLAGTASAGIAAETADQPAESFQAAETEGDDGPSEPEEQNTAEEQLAEVYTGLPVDSAIVTISGDIIQFNYVQQTSFITDHDRADVELSDSHLFLGMGENDALNGLNLYEAGFEYDLIFVSGDLVELDVVQQINVLLDTDDVTYGLGVAGASVAEGSAENGSGTAATEVENKPTGTDDVGVEVTELSPLSTDDNLLYNEVVLETQGQDEDTDIDGEFADALIDVEDGATKIDADVSQNDVFEGSELLRVLHIEGNFTTVNVIAQQNILGDADQVHLALQEFAEDMVNDIQATVGSNILANFADITDVGLDSKVMTVGDTYSDALIHQAEFVDTEAAPEGVQLAPLVTEAVAFLADEIISAAPSAEDMIASIHDMPGLDTNAVDILGGVVS